jgi:hypothetical protein
MQGAGLGINNLILIAILIAAGLLPSSQTGKPILRATTHGPSGHKLGTITCNRRALRWSSI